MSTHTSWRGPLLACLLLAGALLACLSLVGPPAQAASFDCGKARSAMETAICGDPALSALDERLADGYRRARDVPAARAAVTQSQRDWLRALALEGCGGDAACYRAAFSARLAVLDAVAPAGDAAARWTGVYRRQRDGHPDPDTASLVIVGLRGGRLAVSGDAIWRGPNAARGQVNTGEIRGTAILEATSARIDGDGCSATFVLTPKALRVPRESGCGGLNVSFVGDYRRE